MSIRAVVSDKLLMPSLLRFSKCPPWPFYRELRRHDRTNRAELSKIQFNRLKSTLQHAQLNVPYYEEAFAKAGVRAKDIEKWNDLLAIPTISKKQISANFPDRITARGSNRDSWQYFATSGTTDRLMVIKDAEALSRNLALSLYEEQIQNTYSPGSLHLNIPPDACSLACAAAVRRSKSRVDRAKEAVRKWTEKKATGVPRSIAGQVIRKIASPTHEMASFGPDGTRMDPELLEYYVEEIRQRKPAVLSGLPTYLLLLARHIRQSKKAPPQIGSLLPQGALSAPALKTELANAFGAPVHEVYGGHEFGCIASTCEHGEKLHVLMSECLVEIVRNGEHVSAGELGEIVVTSFANRVMPLIRYKPGDVGRLYDTYCRCGRQTQLLVVEGRMEDTLVTSKGIRTEKEITDFLMPWPNLEFFQLVQRSETRCDLLVVEKEQNKTDLQLLANAVKGLLGDEINIRPRLVSTIKPEVSGKFRFVKSTSFQAFHESALAPKFDQPEMAV